MLPITPRRIKRYWLERGLVYVSLGNGLYWTKQQGWVGFSYNQGGIRWPSAHGIVLGYGTKGLNGIDYTQGPILYTTTKIRSFFANVYALSAGGGGNGRIIQPLGAGFDAGHENILVYNLREAQWSVGGTGSAAQWVYANSASPILNEWVTYAGTHDLSLITNVPALYKNGLAVTPFVELAGTGTTIDKQANTMIVGGRSTAPTRSFDGLIGQVYFFEHATLGLTPDEHLALKRNPDIIFADYEIEDESFVPFLKPTYPLLWADPFARAKSWADETIGASRFDFFVTRPITGGGSFTLGTEAGLFVLSGQNAGLRFASRITADYSAYAFVGQSVGFNLGQKLIADHGSYTPSGQAVSLNLGLDILADNAAYTVTGQAVTLTRGVTISADASSYTLSGQAASLGIGLKLQADLAAYASQGQDVTLTLDTGGNIHLSITADNASYIAAGQSAVFGVGLRMLADYSGYTAAGQIVNFLRGKALEALTGAYTYTGQAVNFLRGVLLRADAAVYAFSGQAVGLVWSGTPAVEVVAAARGTTLNLQYDVRTNTQNIIRFNRQSNARNNR